MVEVEVGVMVEVEVEVMVMVMVMVEGERKMICEKCGHSNAIPTVCVSIDGDALPGGSFDRYERVLERHFIDSAVTPARVLFTSVPGPPKFFFQKIDMPMVYRYEIVEFLLPKLKKFLPLVRDNEDLEDSVMCLKAQLEMQKAAMLRRIGRKHQ